MFHVVFHSTQHNLTLDEEMVAFVSHMPLTNRMELWFPCWKGAGGGGWRRIIRWICLSGWSLAIGDVCVEVKSRNYSYDCTMCRMICFG